MAPDDPQVQEFLKRSMNMRVATLSRTGVPHITPLRFIYGGRTICALTRAVTLPVRHIADRPEVVLLFDAEQRGPTGPVLRLQAHAAIRSDPGLAARCQRRAATKYFLRPGGIWNMLTHWRNLPAWVRGRRATRPETNALIEFVPETAEFVPPPS
jgi:hypothetical protein